MRLLYPPQRFFASQSLKIREHLRKKITPPPQETLKQCISASKCQQYDLQKAFTLLAQHSTTPRFLADGEALHAKHNKSDIFVLSSGSVVGWNITEQSLLVNIVPLLYNSEIESFKVIETEDMDFVEETVDQPSGMHGDVIVVNGKTTTDRINDKCAFSSGLSRNTKLSAIENDCEELMQVIKSISSNMASGASQRLGVRQVDKLTGRLLQLRGTLNLYSNITETPDHFWNMPEQERLYELVSKSLDVEKRIMLLNKKLDYMADNVGILRHNMGERISLRVEWMILLLILFEVGMEVSARM